MNEELECDDPNSVGYWYPAYEQVRRSYLRRRQQAFASQGDVLFKSDNPMDIPEKLMVTSRGAIKMALNKPISEVDM